MNARAAPDRLLDSARPGTLRVSARRATDGCDTFADELGNSLAAHRHQPKAVMSELEALNLARSTTEQQEALFAQMLTINFAMVVAIYYFLNTARLTLKLFSFFAYSLGMLSLFGQMLAESNVKLGALEALEKIVGDSDTGPSSHYLAYCHSLVALVTRITFNFAVWLLWLGVLYLLFFAQQHWKPAQTRTVSVEPPA